MQYKNQIVKLLIQLKDGLFNEIDQANTLIAAKYLISWKKNPNVNSFKVTPRDLNILFEYLGLKKHNNFTFEFETHRNLIYNRYIQGKIKRLK